MPARPDMLQLADTQQTFTRALLRAGLQVPAAVAETAGPTRERRFAVYRNNVKASLIATLTAKFPVIHRLVGEEFSRLPLSSSLNAIRRARPCSPNMAQPSLPSSKSFEPAGDLPYLADVARLEWARQEAFHAADAKPVSIEGLAALAAGDLEVSTPDPTPGHHPHRLALAHRVDLDDQHVRRGRPTDRPRSAGRSRAGHTAGPGGPRQLVAARCRSADRQPSQTAPHWARR